MPLFHHLLFLILACFFFFLNCLGVKCQTLEHGVFWHVTDIHVDQNYSRTGDPHDMCHKAATVYPDNGLYGNFLCDSPQSLVNITIKSMKTINSNPDFIIWTGDNLPHSRTFHADWNVIFETINNLSTLLATTFPGISVFPSIGNHDTFPPNVLLPNGTFSIYDAYLKKGGWNKFLYKDAWPTFLTGGYYAQQIRPGLRLISLNTILWYLPNNSTEKLTDPADQFQWFEEVLKNCSDSSEKVYIIGHVPPGFYNRINNVKSDPTYHIQYLEAYLHILKKYSHVILGQMFGHLHMDMFQLFQCSTDDFLSSSILASSVTPWHYENKYNVSLPVNPAIRLMHYSRANGALLDYEQFYMNLTNANLNKSEESNLYQLLYKFRDFYNVPDLSTRSLVKVFENLKSDPVLFDNFFKFLAAGKESVTCDASCKVAQLCSIACTSAEEYSFCMKNSISDTNLLCSATTSKSGGYYVLLCIIIVSIICFAVGLFIFYRKRGTSLHYEPFSDF